MVTVMLDPDVDALLSQTAADLGILPCEVAKVILESSLIMSLTR
jgi:hypothetical protein